MRQGQNRRMRGRNNNNSNNSGGNRKGPNPLQRGYESNGPDVKVRGNAQHIAEKYLQLARDAQSSGDRVMAENYLQHAEHYFRLVLAAQEQMSQQYGTTFQPQRFGEDAEEGDEDGEEDGQQAYPFGVAQPNQSGEANEGTFTQPGFDGQPRQDRNQDRNGQDRGGQDRNDRNNNQRFDRNRDRNGNGNRDRNDRGQDRAPRPYDRADGQPDDQPRQDRAQNDRNGAPRHQDFRPAQPRVQDSEQPEVTREAYEPRQDREPRQERAPRVPRERYDRERAPRAERSGEAEVPVADALPAFLTNPVRVPIAVETPVAAVAGASPAAEAEAAPKKPRGRPRRSPREVMDALATEPGDTPGE